MDDSDSRRKRQDKDTAVLMSDDAHAMHAHTHNTAVLEFVKRSLTSMDSLKRSINFFSKKASFLCASYA
jgi:hypothetical protein